jgi:hypothetical protein
MGISLQEAPNRQRTTACQQHAQLLGIAESRYMPYQILGGGLNWGLWRVG